MCGVHTVDTMCPTHEDHLIERLYSSLTGYKRSVQDLFSSIENFSLTESERHRRSAN